MSSADHDQGDGEERRGSLVRRVFSSGQDPEARLQELLAARSHELEEHAERLRDSIAELERREELLRDSRTSVERMLRLGTSELEAREAELSSFLREITERETALAEAEHDLERRRQELGAVELKRAAVERRERDLAARESAVEEREARADERASVAPDSDVDVELVFVPGTQYHLLGLEPTPLRRGLEFEVGDDQFVVLRVGRSPLPGDERRCAYLVRGNRRPDDSSGNT